MRSSTRLLVTATAALVILLASTAPALAKSADRNHNKIPDKWEKKYHLSLKKSQAKKDADKDGLTAINEYLAGTSPKLKDTDHDGVRDGLEDRDGDGLVNLGEVKAKTGIRVADTDHDGVLDGAEDPDRDGLTNAQEFGLGTSLRRADTDRNGVSDGDEDFDWDGLTNSQEFVVGTDPEMEDTNGDGTLDCDEDYDGDVLSNFDEFMIGTDPCMADSNHDGVDDGDEDYDGDGRCNSDEIAQGTDPMVRDSEDGSGDDGTIDEGTQYSGTIEAFDAETGILTLTADDEDATTVEVVVDDNTALAWGDTGPDMGMPEGDPTFDDLLPGAYIEDMTAEEQDDGSLLATDITLSSLADDQYAGDELVAQVVSFDADSSTLTLMSTDDEGDVYDVLIDADTEFAWADGASSDHDAGVDDLVPDAGVVSIDTTKLGDGSQLATQIVLEPVDPGEDW